MSDEYMEEQEETLERRSSGRSVRHLADVLFGFGLVGGVLLGILVSVWTDEPLYGLFAGLAAGYLVWAYTRILRSFGEMAEDAAATRKAVEKLLAIQAEEHTYALMIRQLAAQRAARRQEEDESVKYKAE